MSQLEAGRCTESQPAFGLSDTELQPALATNTTQARIYHLDAEASKQRKMTMSVPSTIAPWALPDVSQARRPVQEIQTFQAVALAEPAMAQQDH